MYTLVFLSFICMNALLGSDVLCIGNALVDTFAFVSGNRLSQAGVEKGGEISVSSLYFENQLSTLSKTQKKVTGGSAANTAKGLGRLGCSVSLLARLGNDTTGQFVQSVMAEHNVHLCTNLFSGTTSRVLCLITPDGQRSFLFCGGTVGITSPLDVNESTLQKTKIVHHDGYILRNKPLLEKSLDLCNKLHIVASLDLGSFSLVREHKKYILENVLPRIDILIGNSDEMHTLFGSDQEIHKALLQRSALSVHLKSKKGCTLYCNGKALEIPTHPKKPIDSTGAGDLFTSGFLYGLLHNWSLEKSARMGHSLAGEVISHIGAEIPLHIWKERNLFSNQEMPVDSNL